MCFASIQRPRYSSHYETTLPRSNSQLRQDALAIWSAGVDAVRSDRLIRDQVTVSNNHLQIHDASFPLAGVRRIVVTGAGKAGAGMAAGLEDALGAELLESKQVSGWVNIPAGCERPLQRIHLHAARPAGVNEPTTAGVKGAREMLRLMSQLTPQDLCICLISGGGSALLPAPVDGVTLEAKQQVTRFLSAAGANIEELNAVRTHLSQLKGGGLVEACGGAEVVTLIISDVLGDPLDIIASGPTVPSSVTPHDALAVLARFDTAPAAGLQVPASVYTVLRQAAEAFDAGTRPQNQAAFERVSNFVIGNNAVAVDAAGMEAERRGYAFSMNSAHQPEGLADDAGRHLAHMARLMRSHKGPDCLITGGEPVVQLAPAEERGKGGRNQQLVLAALDNLTTHRTGDVNPLEGIALVSGGTDGEDGPTNAAGAVIDAGTHARMEANSLNALDIESHLEHNNAYNFFAPLNDLLITGPTHTNVCDLRVLCVSQHPQ